MIPKIGGSALGCEQATGTRPLLHVSWDEFRDRDAHLGRYWPEVPFLYPDTDPEVRVAEVIAGVRGRVDIAFAVCPCSGLSMLNTAKEGRAGRGAGAEKNQWMMKTSEWVLGNIEPRVLIGENAPGLFSEAGDKVVCALRQLAQKFGYSFSLLRTNTEQHELPQKRIRTFYFFWKSSKAPILSWINSKIPRLEEYLDLIPPEATLQDLFIHEGVASQRYRPYQFILEKEGLTHAAFSKKFKKGTIAKYLEKYDLIDECIDWLKLRYPGDKFSVEEASNTRTHVMTLEHIKRKLAMGRGYWDDSIKFMGDSFTAVIKKNLVSAIHPSQDRFLSVREALHLMGFPHDFEITELKHLNHICQTVPVHTARDWALEAVKFIRGELKLSDSDLVRQDNISQTISTNAEENKNYKKRKSGEE